MKIKTTLTHFFLATLLFFMTYSASMAQGLLGRKVILTYQPAFCFTSALAHNQNTQIFYEYINHHAMIEYVSNRRISYGGEMTFFSFNATEGYQVHSYGPSLFVRIHGTKKAGAIAPIGNYNKLGVQLLFSQVNDFSGQTTEDLYVNVKPVTFATTWVIGKRVPLSDTILLDYGVDLSYLTLIPSYIPNRSLASRFFLNFKLGIAFAAL